MKQIFAFVSAMLLLVSFSQACFQTPKGFYAGLSEGVKEVFLFHDGTNGHMVIRTRLNAKRFPKKVAWVLPLPAMPTKYEEIDGPIFGELNEIFPVPPGSFGGGSTEGATKGIGSAIRVHAPVTVGQFVIQPIEIMKDGSVQELNAWLEKNKFEKLSAGHEKTYLKKGAAFLVINMEMNRPGESGLLSRPLHIVYPSDQVTYPIKSHHEGWKFDLDLFVFSKQALKKDLAALNLQRTESVPYENKHLHPFVDKMISAKGGFFTRYSGQELNSNDKPVSALPSDPTFNKAEL
jgi:hypothetical protein